MRETLKFRQKVRVSLWVVDGQKYDVYASIQSELLKEALLETRKAHPGKVVTAITIVFLTPVYGSEVSKAGVLYEWYDCNTRTTVEIADPPEAGMFDKTLTFF